MAVVPTTLAIWEKFVHFDPRQRSIFTPSWLAALFVQVSLIWLLFSAEAARLLGAARGAEVVVGVGGRAVLVGGGGSGVRVGVFVGPGRVAVGVLTAPPAGRQQVINAS